MINIIGIKNFFNKNKTLQNISTDLLFPIIFLITLYGFFIFFNQNAISYFSIAAALAAGLFLLFLSALVKPKIFLFAAIVAINNPVSIYFVITDTWKYGIVRAGISVFFIILFLISFLLKGSLRGKIDRIKTPLDSLLVIFLFFPLMAATYSFFYGYPANFIFADLLAFVEFIAYFFITTIIIKDRKQLNFILKSIMTWLILTELGEIIFYFFAYGKMGYQAAPGGIIVKRLADFMAAITLPILAGLYFYPGNKGERGFNKKRISILFLAMIPATSLMLGFFRSLWMGVTAALFFIFSMCWRKKNNLRSILIALVLLGVLFLSIDYFIIPKTSVFKGQSLIQLVYERVFTATGMEQRSVFARFESSGVLLEEIYKSPIIGNGFGTPITHGLSNYLLGVAYSMGIPALFFFGWLGFIFFKSGIKIFHQSQGVYKGWVLGILASFVSVGVFSLTFPAMLHYPVAAYLGILGACLFIIFHLEIIDKNNNKKNDLEKH